MTPAIDTRADVGDAGRPSRHQQSRRVSAPNVEEPGGQWPQPIGGTIYKAYVMGINGICQAGEIDVLFLWKSEVGYNYW